MCRWIFFNRRAIGWPHLGYRSAGMKTQKTDTLGGFFVNQLSTYQEMPAIRFRGEDNRLFEIGYGRLLEVVYGAAAGLHKLRIRPGSRVAIVAGLSPESIIAYAAVHICGAVDVTVDPDEDTGWMQRTLEKAQADLVLTDSPFLYDFLRSRQFRTVLLTWENKKGVSLLGLAGRQGRRRFLLPVHGHRDRLPDDPASVIFRRWPSSGRPQGVVLTHKSILTNVEQISSVVPTTEFDPILSAVPFHLSQGRLPVLLAFHKGCTLYVSTPASFGEDVARESVVLAAALPESLNALYQSIFSGSGGESLTLVVLRKLYLIAYDLMSFLYTFSRNRLPRFGPGQESPFLRISAIVIWALLRAVTIPGQIFFGRELRRRVGRRLRGVMTGGGRLRKNVDRFFQNVGVYMLEGYWLTQASHAVAMRLMRYTGQRKRLVEGTVGPMLPGTELRLLSSLGDDVSHTPGAIGRIQVRGPQIMQGFYEDEGATREVVDERGWMTTGDTGRITNSGELQLLGRSDLSGL